VGESGAPALRGSPGVGVFAAGLSAADQRARSQMLSWFIGGHAIVCFMLTVQIAGPLGVDSHGYDGSVDRRRLTGRCSRGAARRASSSRPIGTSRCTCMSLVRRRWAACRNAYRDRGWLTR
jgi:hypothetical protein